jgi:hypothetical protein
VSIAPADSRKRSACNRKRESSESSGQIALTEHLTDELEERIQIRLRLSCTVELRPEPMPEIRARLQPAQPVDEG